MNYTLTSLTVGYGQRAVVRCVDAELAEGQLTCLLGPNGAGKSTLLRTLAGFQKPLEGRLRLGPDDALALSAQEMSRRVSVVLTERVEGSGLRVADVVELGRSPYTDFFGRFTADDRRHVRQAMQLTGIEPLRERLCHTLSDGERQKAMIAKALAQQTDVILLDEPTAFLDFPSKVDTMLLLSRLAHDERKAVLASTHDLDLALQVADRLWLITPEGSLISGAPKDLAASGELARAFDTSHVSFDVEDLRFRIRQA